MTATRRQVLAGLASAGLAGCEPTARLGQIPIGMNLSGISDFDPGFPFRNLMWGARPWLTRNAELAGGPWDTKFGSKLELDEDGYPLESPAYVAGTPFRQIPFTLVPNVRRPGVYVLLHDGEGVIEGLLGTRVISSEPGRIMLNMTHDGRTPEVISIVRSSRYNHIRNIRILPLEDEKADLERNPFLTEFLDFCRPFHCLRFMDWFNTNGSLVEEWSDRKRPTFYTMVGEAGDPEGQFTPTPTPFSRRFAGGVAYEVAIKLANLLEVSPWICIPHRASSDCISQFSKFVADTLDTRQRVYLEYSNELWNFGFIQAQWALKSQYAAGILSKAGIKAWQDIDQTRGTAHPERIGALFSRAFDLWMKNWPSNEKKRVVRVCAVQQAWADASLRTATWCARNGGADALAPAAYFAPTDLEYAKWQIAGANLTSSNVIADMQAVIQRDAGPSTREQGKIAQRFGWNYLVYEGGQHLIPKGNADVSYNLALSSAQRDPGMYDLYIENIAHQQRAGCTLFCAFSSVSSQGTKWGSWGVKESYDQPLESAPKLRALLDLNVPRT